MTSFAISVRMSAILLVHNSSTSQELSTISQPPGLRPWQKSLLAVGTSLTDRAFTGAVLDEA